MRLRTVALAGLVALAACSPPSAGTNGLGVVATTSIIGDIVESVAPPGVSVEVLIPLGVDPHDFRPSSAQVAAISSADVVFANGGGLEEGLVDVLESARSDGARVVELLGSVGPLRRDGSLDPHFWLDPVRSAEAARVVAAELGTTGSDRVVAYLTALEEAHAEIEGWVSGHEAEMRKLVTNHDSLGYWADRYGFEVIGVVIPGGSTLGDPSSQDLARLVELIDEGGIEAIFVDVAASSVLAEAIAAEVDHPVQVVGLHTGSLGGPGSGAETLIDLILLNSKRISNALIG